MAFRKAERRNARLRLAFSAPAGGGKTYGMLLLLKCLLAALKLPGRVAVLDSERGSSEKYAQKQGTPEGPGNWDFDVERLEEKNVGEYLLKIQEAANAGYPALGVDSYSHSWLGALEAIDRLGGWTKGGKTVSPQVAKLVDAILSYPGHVVATMRSKVEHVIVKDEKTGKSHPEKVGMAPVARDGTEYEFDVWLDADLDGQIKVTKSRAHGTPLTLGSTWDRSQIPQIAEILAAWLDAGAPVSERDQLIEAIRFSGDDAALSTLLARLKTFAATAKPEDVAMVKAAYMARKAALQGAGNEFPTE